MSKKCYNGGNKHNFKPRYDEVPFGVKNIKGKYTCVSELKSLLVYNVYVKDVCTWCGKEIKK